MYLTISVKPQNEESENANIPEDFQCGGRKRKAEDDNDEVRAQRLNELAIVHAEMPNDTGSRKKHNNLDLHNKKSIITIKNKDNLCLARALVVQRTKTKGTSY
jgi:hypothetical protein